MPTFKTEVLRLVSNEQLIKWLYVAMWSLVMSLCSRDLHVTSFNTLNSSRLTMV